MMNARSEARFFQKHRLEFGLSELGQDGLERYQTIEATGAVLTSRPDLGHSPARDLDQHFTRAQPRTRHHLANCRSERVIVVSH